MTSSTPDPDAELDALIEAAVAKAVQRVEAMGLDTASSPYFAPRRLGATAPHECEIWTTDVVGDPRGREGPEVSDQLERLLAIGRRGASAA